MPKAKRFDGETRPVKIPAVDTKEPKDPPGDLLPDSTALLVRDGYRFVSKRCARHASDVFRTRLLARSVVCMRGEAAARLFYDPHRFQRAGALPGLSGKTLFGRGSIHDLDGDEHRTRKGMYLSVLSPQRVEDLVEIFERDWNAALLEWSGSKRIVLLDEVARLLFRSACEWSGLRVPRREVKERTRDIVAMIEGTGSLGLRHWRGARARLRMEHWMGTEVDRVRLRKPRDGDPRALHVFAWHRDAQGILPAKQMIAVELLNLLTGVVAVSYYVALCAVALDRHPEWARRVREGGDEESSRFVEEVRRLYPLFPLVAAVVREDLEWGGFRFRGGQHVLLDLFGTNRHPDSWGAPDRFHPDRFRGHEDGAYDFVPQGGGDRRVTHRCAGETATVALMKSAVRALAVSMRFEVPRQDMTVDLSRIPARPKSGFVVERPRPVDDVPQAASSSFSMRTQSASQEEPPPSV